MFDRAALPRADTKTVLIIGHRGAAGLAPENTLPGFSRAVALGVRAVELDVHAVEDQLVVIHDERLERTTNGHGAVASCSLAELRALDAGSGAPIPLLAEVFELLPAHVGINVELKGKATGPRLAEFLGDFPQHRVLVSSFDHRELRTFHETRPTEAVAPLFGRWRREVWAIAREFDAWSVNLSVRIATRARIASAHKRGFRVLVYTVNDLQAARRLAAWGVDGIFTDYPDRITPDSLSGSIPD